MKSIRQELKEDINEFSQNWYQYVVLVLSLDLFNQFIVIPAFRFVTTYILQASAIPFVSVQNIKTIITTHTLMFITLIVEIFLLLIIIYIQVAFLLLGIRAIRENNFYLKYNFILTWHAIKRMKLSSIVLMLIYFLFLVPIVDIIFRTPLLAKIQLPEFILDYMTRSFWLGLFLVVLYLLLFWLSIRFILALPAIILKKYQPKKAIQISWRITSHYQWWHIIRHLLTLIVGTIIILLLFDLLVYLCQLIWDLFPGKYALILGIFNLTLIQIVSEIMFIFMLVLALLLIFRNLLVEQKKIISLPQINKSKISAVFLTFLFLISAISYNAMYLTGTNSKAPLTISHRGVDNHDAVQNTIPALRKIAQEKPDYVEIDLHETKDKKFVVLHDENLLKLANINKMPSQLTLNQLTKITIKEDGHQAKIASFDQYLREAHKLKQKLLIEIKTTPNDSKKILQRFNAKYGKLIVERKYQVQSLDYRVVQGLTTLNPKLFVLYLQPYNFTFPQSKADGYSMEYSTLNPDFVWQAHLNKRPVYAWTINDGHLMKKMMYEQVDGIITDRLRLLKKKIREFQEDATYANRIRNYIFVLPMKYDLQA